ncbi:hypothetical protein ACWDTI_12025 [Gordonia sp. NPDC003424]
MSSDLQREDDSLTCLLCGEPLATAVSTWVLPGPGLERQASKKVVLRPVPGGRETSRLGITSPLVTDDQPQWPPILANRGEEWIEGTAAVVGLGGMAAGFFTGAFRWILALIAVAAAVLGVCIARARREKAILAERADRAVADETDARWLQIIEDRIGALLRLILKVVNTADPAARRDLASSARTAIISLASADAMGVQGASVRMNLFKLGDDHQMRPEAIGSSGRYGVHPVWWTSVKRPG